MASTSIKCKARSTRSSAETRQGMREDTQINEWADSRFFRCETAGTQQCFRLSLKPPSTANFSMRRVRSHTEEDKEREIIRLGVDFFFVATREE